MGVRRWFLRFWPKNPFFEGFIRSDRLVRLRCTAAYSIAKGGAGRNRTTAQEAGRTESCAGLGEVSSSPAITAGETAGWVDGALPPALLRPRRGLRRSCGPDFRSPDRQSRRVPPTPRLIAARWSPLRGGSRPSVDGFADGTLRYAVARMSSLISRCVPAPIDSDDTLDPPYLYNRFCGKDLYVRRG